MQKMWAFLHLTVAILHCVEKTIQVKPQEKRKIKRNLKRKNYAIIAFRCDVL